MVSASGRSAISRYMTRKLLAVDRHFISLHLPRYWCKNVAIFSLHCQDCSWNWKLTLCHRLQHIKWSLLNNTVFLSARFTENSFGFSLTLIYWISLI